MKVAICDDEKIIRDLIAESIQDVSKQIIIESYEDATGILDADFDAEILFLDIQMPGMDWMKAARALRSAGKKTVIVFVTALEEQVFNAFDVGAFNYIVKPFSKNRLIDIINNAIKQSEDQQMIEKMMTEKDNCGSVRSITVKSGGSNTNVILSELVYAEIFDRRIILHMINNNSIEYYGRISDLEKIVGKDFFRVHRAYLINLGYVRSYDSKIVRISDTSIPVARGKYPELIKAYMSYHTRRENL